MKKTVLVSGLSGFVGQHLKTFLESKNCKVIGIPHDLFYSYEPSLEQLAQEVKPDWIVHLASYGNMHYQKDWDDIFHGNLTSTYNFLNATKNIPYEAFINISTSSVKLEYETMYSACKAGAERLCRAFASEFNKPIVSIRPFTLYGIGEQEDHLIPRIFRSCLFKEPLKFSPNPTHDFVYIKDFTEAIFAIASQSKEYQGMSLQCGTGWATSNQRVLEYIEMLTGRKAHLTGSYDNRSYDTDNWRADPREGFVWYTHTLLEEGLQKVYKSYKL